MRKITSIFILILFLAVIGISGCSNSNDLNDSSVMKELRKTATSYDSNQDYNMLKHEAKSPDDNPNDNKTQNFTVKGKIVMLNMCGAPGGKIDGYIHEDTDPDIPDELKGDVKSLSEGKNENLTVLCIMFQEQKKEGMWGITGDMPGYSLGSYIVVIYWPENKVIGEYYVKGSPPPVIASRSELNGDQTDNIDKWILSMPRT